MCGITGFWDLKQRTSAQQMHNTLVQMSDTLMHRGPDGAGIWIDPKQGVAFAHRRLAIIDLSEHGKQPMHSACGRYVISFNGEIYNHLELKQELNAVHWQGHSDTAVILAAFSAWGIAATLNKLVGMFAIALWDKQEQRLFLIRDRLGEKPLYYGWAQDYLLFGSELNSLKAHFAWQQAIDQGGVDLLLQFNCIPAPYTIYKDIYKLEPGHYLCINADNSSRKIAYWQLKDVINRSTVISDPWQATNLLETNLKQAVRQQMLADVPVGAFLSGGIDSSTIVALMQAQSSRPVKTFTIGFADAAYNEAEQAKVIATHLGTNHTELYLSAEDTKALIPNLPYFYDEPFADSSQLPTYMVAKLARQHVTVCLSGDGGDELFAGYNRYMWLERVWRKIAKLPKPLKSLLVAVVRICPPRDWDKLFVVLNKFLPNALQQRNPGEKLYKLATLCQAKDTAAIYNLLRSHWTLNAHALPDLAQDLIQPQFTQSLMYMDSLRYLPDDILVKVDRAAMALSLETRMPFLDHRLVEFAWSLPLEFKIRNGQNKWILRQVLKRYVPSQLYERPKMGFAVPIDQLLRGSLKEWAQDLLTESMLNKHKLLPTKMIQQRWREHLSGTGNWQYHLWDVLVFQSWYEAYHG